VRAWFPNPTFLKELEVDPETVQVFEDAAGKVAAEANKLRHRIMPSQKGDGVEVRNNSTRVNLDIYVVNTDYGSHIDEWGSVNNPAYAPLRNAVSAAGLDFEPEPKR
jgi:hypothetical protein